MDRRVRFSLHFPGRSTPTKASQSPRGAFGNARRYTRHRPDHALAFHSFASSFLREGFFIETRTARFSDRRVWSLRRRLARHGSTGTGRRAGQGKQCVRTRSLRPHQPGQRQSVHLAVCDFERAGHDLRRRPGRDGRSDGTGPALHAAAGPASPGVSPTDCRAAQSEHARPARPPAVGQCRALDGDCALDSSGRADPS